MPDDSLSSGKRNRANLLRRNLILSESIFDALQTVKKALEAQTFNLLFEIKQLEKQRQTVSPSMLFERGRLKKLLAEVETEISRAAQRLGKITESAQKTSIIAAIGENNKILRASDALKQGITGFDSKSLVKLVGYASDEKTPLTKMYQRIGEPLSKRIQETLIVGLGTGASNDSIAANIRRNFDTSAVHAQTIARTETNNAYREATREIYKANPKIVKGYMWYSGLDLRACPICWSLHGKIFKTNRKFISHPNCRCTLIPYNGKNQIKTGEKEFAALTDAQKLTIIGETRFDLYKSGTPLENFVAFQKSEYGITPVILPLDSVKIETSKSKRERAFKATIQKPTKPAPKPTAAPAPPKPSANLALAEMEKIQRRRDFEFSALELSRITTQAEIDRLRANGQNDLSRLNDLQQKADEIEAKLNNHESETLNALRRTIRLNPSEAGSIKIKFVSNFSRIDKAKIAEKVKDWNSLVSKDLFDNVEIGFRQRSGRAAQGGGTVYISANRNTTVFIHEIAHWFEQTGGRKKGDILQKSIEFFNRRTAGEKEQLLSRLFGNRAYGSEKATPDKFFSPYCGKVYRFGTGDIRATEIVSMGIEYYFANPLEFARKDFDYFEFIYKLVRGL